MENWDANTIEAYLFQNTGAGDKGIYPLVALGLPLFDTDEVYYGTYAYKVEVYGNAFRLHDNLQTHLGTLGSWCIEGWHYISSGGVGVQIWNPFVSNNWNILGIIYRNDNNRYYKWYNGAEASAAAGVTEDAYHHFSIEWDGSKIYFYVDGILKDSWNNVNNIFNGWATDTYIGQALYGSFNPFARINRVIISNIRRFGVETVPLPPQIAAGFSKDSFMGSHISKGGFR